MLLTLVVTLFSVTAYAQQKQDVNLDGVTKMFAIASTVLGLAIGVLQLYVANKLAKTEAKVYQTINEMERKFFTTLDFEVDKIELKVQGHLKDMEGKMATKHDIIAIERLIAVQFENIKLQIQVASKT